MTTGCSGYLKNSGYSPLLGIGSAACIIPVNKLERCRSCILKASADILVKAMPVVCDWNYMRSSIEDTWDSKVAREVIRKATQ